MLTADPDDPIWWYEFNEAWIWTIDYFELAVGRKPDKVNVSQDEFSAACEMFDRQKRFIGMRTDWNTGMQQLSVDGVFMRVSTQGSLVRRVRLAKCEIEVGFDFDKFRSAVVALRTLAASERKSG